MEATKCPHCGAWLGDDGMAKPSNKETLDRARTLRTKAGFQRSRAHYARVAKLMSAARSRIAAEKRMARDKAAYLEAAKAGKAPWRNNGKRCMERLPKKPADPC